MPKSVERPGTSLVLEVGGTTIRAACVATEGGVVLERAHEPSPNFLLTGDADPLHLTMDLMATLGSEVLASGTPDVVIIAFPGPVLDDGTVIVAPTLAGSGSPTPMPVGDLARINWPDSHVVVVNDVTAAGYRYLDGPSSDHSTFCILTVGSGIGHTTFVEGRPQSGPRGRGGEIGHLRVDASDDAPVCDCGLRGHLGAISSGRGAERLVRRRIAAQPGLFATSQLAGLEPGDITGRDIAAAFRSDDPAVVAAIAETVAPLGGALAAIHLDIGVERFVIIGGFSRALGEPYRAMLATAAARSCWNIGQDWNSMIALGHDDDDQGIVGGAVIASMVMAGSWPT